jgi:hyperosmotically inducible periplasmic protein
MRTHLLAFTLAAAFGAGACKSKPENQAADNTAKNARDKSAVPTADQAGQSKSDTDLAQSLRKAITDDSSLSTNAHNCKVIVNAGVVTLAGPVASSDERTKIEGLATATPGVTKVVNQLEIAN